MDDQARSWPRAATKVPQGTWTGPYWDDVLQDPSGKHRALDLRKTVFHPYYSVLLKFLVRTLTGTVSTIKFFFFEAFLGQHFEAVELEASKPQPGDLFLFRLLNPAGRWCGAHVGVYCGHGEIIHFEGRIPSGQGRCQVLGSWEGVVCKQGQLPLQRSRQLWCVLRRRGGVDHVRLERRVREAMAMEPPAYHPTRYNCVHFAMHLLGLDRSPGLEDLDLDLTMD